MNVNKRERERKRERKKEREKKVRERKREREREREEMEDGIRNIYLPKFWQGKYKYWLLFCLHPSFRNS